MNGETKRHIDVARQVLVGVVPSPTAQIDQITNALIYKFMDDMDQAAIKAGGNPSFFTGDLERYAWTRLMDTRIGNQERMNLYSEALLKFSQAKQLPPLFRELFKSAFLPYRSPETLNMFLKEIEYFDYSHSEELGNAYEYLLSIMSSQGDAGQFRTPRHIIDFMVEVVAPTKDDTVLDPACGTAGFLISAYKHILRQHDGKDDPDHKEKPLTPEERKKLFNNFEGYDIDPTMARIAQVNMYLHQFKNPRIYQYDTLSQEERWNDRFDVIMANPPFMSPKGGIKPHSKFSIQSSRSEVLFVDYIMEHLKPKGRAAIIVPEGIIFQSGKGHTQLRKNLVEDGLYAVVSLPSGVFNPYAGVKTSILFFDNKLAKQQQEILFIKIEHDGYAIGAQRRPIQKNDLPDALEILNKWRTGTSKESKLAVYVEKSKIAENGNYNLSGDRYRFSTDYANAKWPLVELGEVCDVATGNSAPQDETLFENGKYPFFRTSDVGSVHLSVDLKDVRDWLNDRGIVGLRLFKKGTILFPKSGASTFLNHRVVMGMDGYVSSHLATIVPKNGSVNSTYIYHLLVDIDAKSLTPDQAYPSLKASDIAKIKIPLPPLEIQEQIVAELDGYASIIAGAKQIAQNWKPKIDIDPEWEKVKLGEVCDFENGDRGVNYPSKSNRVDNGIPFINTGHLTDDGIDMENMDYISRERFDLLGGGKVQRGDILFCLRGSLGKYAKVENFSEGAIASSLVIIRPKKEIMADFLMVYFGSAFFADMILESKNGVAQPNLAAGSVKSFEIPLPLLAIQRQIVEEIEAERALIKSAKKLIPIYEQKTKEVIAKLWNS